jgi:hypothetical protein
MAPEYYMFGVSWNIPHMGKLMKFGILDLLDWVFNLGDVLCNFVVFELLHINTYFFRTLSKN